MDGIAVRAADLPWPPRAGAGRLDDRVVAAAGTFEWIDTGDPMPAGTDTVVVRERLLPQDRRRRAHRHRRPGPAAATGGTAARGRNVRAAGRGLRGRVRLLVPAGRRLRPGDLAAAAAGGHVTRGRGPAARRRDHPDRGRDPAGRRGAAPRRHHRHQLAHARRALPPARRACPWSARCVPDDPDALAAELRRAAADADLVLVIAGSSRGRGDHAAAVLAQVGGVAVAGVGGPSRPPALLGHANAGRHAVTGRDRAGRSGCPGTRSRRRSSSSCSRRRCSRRSSAAGRHAPDVRAAARPRLGLPGPTSRSWVLVTLAADPADGAPLATPGQARRGLDQPARPRRRLVADPGRPGHVPGGHRDRGPPDPWRPLRLTRLTIEATYELQRRRRPAGRIVHSVTKSR